MSRGGRGDREVHGVLAIDKPLGASSFDVVRAVRQATGTSRVGHAGTLDPMATGLLLVCLNEATKAVPWLMDAPKAYEATLALGAETDTDDAEGRVIARADVPALDAEALERALATFRGPHLQIPPRFSALHHGGERLYELARRGEEVDLAPRPVDVHTLTLVSMSLPAVTLRVVCGKGFYVRALARDLGRALGCGAHLTALRRTATVGFDIADAVTFDAVIAPGADWRAALVPLDRALAHLPSVVARGAELRAVLHGNIVPWPQPLPAGPDGLLRVHDDAGLLLAVGRAAALAEGQELRIVRGFQLPGRPEPAPRVPGPSVE